MRPALSCCFLLLLAVTLVVAEDPPARPEAPAELPHWPIALWAPDAVFDATNTKQRKRKFSKAEVLAWLPEDVAALRALLIIPANSDSKHVGEHAPLRAVATRHGMAIIYLRTIVHWQLGEAKDTTLNQQILEALAQHTGHQELATVPWVVFGKSSMGKHPIWMSWTFPERTIAAVTYHGETPTWPIAPWARAPQEHSIPYLCINGETEWMGTWYRHVRPCLLNHRANTAWLPHQVVVPGVGHGDYADAHGSPGWGQEVGPRDVSCLRVWDYIALYLDKVLTLRLPAAAGEPLRPIDPSGGLLVHPRAVEVVAGYRQRPIRHSDGMFRIVDHVEEPHEVYAEAEEVLDPEAMIMPPDAVPEAERRDWFWLPDRELADAWLALHRHPQD